LKRVPSSQPYADIKPLLLPRGGVWWQRMFQFTRSWVGALLLLSVLNILALFYYVGIFSNPMAFAKKAMEVLAIQQAISATEEGVADGALLTKLNTEIVSLKTENESLKALMKKSQTSSNDMLSVSKLSIAGNNIYWQALVKPAELMNKNFILDVRAHKAPVVMAEMLNEGRPILVKAGGDLFDGTTNLYSGNYLAISLWDQETKKLIEAKILKVR
jgi:hypothetical protein